MNTTVQLKMHPINLSDCTQKALLCALSGAEIGYVAAALPELRNKWDKNIRKAWHYFPTQIVSFRFRFRYLCRIEDTTVSGPCEVMHYFAVICVHGHLELAKYIHKRYKIGLEDVRTYYRKDVFILTACENGHLDILKFLHKTIGVRAVHLDLQHYTEFVAQVAVSHLDVLRYLRAEMGLTATDVRRYNNHALTSACVAGDVEAVKYLHTEFGLTVHDARGTENWPLFAACKGGHLEVVKYLHTEFGLTGDDALDGNCTPFGVACEYGHFEVIKYLHKNFGVDASERTIPALMSACRYGHLEVMKYMLTEFGHTAEDARFGNNRAFVGALGRDHLDAAEYLRILCGITAEDVMASGIGRSVDSWERTQYLCETFGLAIDALSPDF